MNFLRAFFQRFRRERAPLIDPDGEMLKRERERLDAVARMDCDTWPEMRAGETVTRGPHKPEICGSTPRPATRVTKPSRVKKAVKKKEAARR